MLGSYSPRETLTDCRRRNSCSIVSGDVSNCSYRLTVGTYILSSVRVSIRPRFFLYAKNTQKLSRRPTPAQVFFECAGHGRSIASDNMSGNNSDHSDERLSQNGNNESLYLHDLKRCGLGLLLRSPCVCTTCVKNNNGELFLNAFPFENSFYFISGYA